MRLSINILKTIKKFWLFFKVNFEYFLEYRGDLAVSFLIKLAVFGAFYFIWSRIDAEGKTIQGYGLSGIILYYLLAEVLGAVVTSQTAKDLRDNIMSGELSAKLVKPFSLYMFFLGKSFARIFSEIFVHIILTIPIVILWPQILSNVSLSFTVLLEFMCSIFLASFFGFNLYFFIGLISFWAQESSGLQSMVRNSMKLLVGDLIPLDLLPLWFQNILFIFPFPYTLYFPIKILMGTINSGEFFHAVVIMIFWILVFMVFNRILWKKGLKEYEAIGM